MSIALLPCNHAIFVEMDDVSSECISDAESQLAYLGETINFKLIYNNEYMRLENYDERRIE